MTVVRIDAPAIAGIPVQHVVHDGIVPARIAMPNWTGSRVDAVPLVFHHAMATPDDLRPGPGERALYELAHCIFARAADGHTLVRFSALGAFPPHVVHAVKPGYEYAISYAAPPADPLVHGTRDRTVFALALAQRGTGLTVHAVGWMDDGAAIVAPGQSGAGKSTLARRLREHDPELRVLSDDRIVLTAEPDDMRAWGTPWCSAAHALDVGDAPLRAVILPAKGAHVSVRNLGAAERAQRLLALLSLPLWSGDEMEIALALADRIASDTPMVEVTWPPTAGAAGEVRELAHRVARGESAGV